MAIMLPLLLFALVVTCSAFMPKTQTTTGLRTRSQLNMGGKMSKFGIFSPAVYGAKFVLGEAKLNKLRGKAISLHSQAITEWCLFYGAYNLRLRLIKMAKKNGDTLGFLV